MNKQDLINEKNELNAQIEAIMDKQIALDAARYQKEYRQLEDERGEMEARIDAIDQLLRAPVAEVAAEVEAVDVAVVDTQINFYNQGTEYATSEYSEVDAAWEAMMSVYPAAYDEYRTADEEAQAEMRDEFEAGFLENLEVVNVADAEGDFEHPAEELRCAEAVAADESNNQAAVHFNDAIEFSARKVYKALIGQGGDDAAEYLRIIEVAVKNARQRLNL